MTMKRRVGGGDASWAVAAVVALVLVAIVGTIVAFAVSSGGTSSTSSNDATSAYTAFRNQTVVGPKFEELEAILFASVQKCAKRCSELGACAGFVFDRNGKSCSLKAESTILAGRHEVPASDVYVRNALAPAYARRGIVPVVNP